MESRQGLPAPQLSHFSGCDLGQCAHPPCFSFPHCKMLITASTHGLVDDLLKSTQESTQCQLGTKERLTIQMLGLLRKSEAT